MTISPFLKKTTAICRLRSAVICHINHDKVDDLDTFKAWEQFISANDPMIQGFEIFRKGKGERKEESLNSKI